MRKRVVTGVLAIIGVVVSVYVISQPRKDSVEYHKRKYLKARDGSRMFRNFQADWYRITGHLPKSFARQTPVSPTEMETHERALMKLGYIEERRFDTIGPQSTAVELYHAFAINSARRGNVFVEYPIARIVDAGPDFVVVRAAREDMPKWEAVIYKDRGRKKRKIDVPENGN